MNRFALNATSRQAFFAPRPYSWRPATNASYDRSRRSSACSRRSASQDRAIVSWAASLCGNQPVCRVHPSSGEEPTPSSRRRVDGVEIDAAIQDERAVNLISTQVGADLLADWDNSVSKFVRVMPTDYKAVLEKMKAEEALETAA